MEKSFLFDIDGVITSPYTKKINNDVIRFIAEKLVAKKPTAIATGRGLFWIVQHILPRIAEYLSSKEDLDYLFISGEKGGVWMEFTHGEPEQHVNRFLSFPADLAEMIRTHVAGIEGIFFDTGKYTMVSIEINGSEDKKIVATQEKTLKSMLPWLKKTLEPFSGEFYIDIGEISIDVLNKQATKRLAASSFLNFVEQKKRHIDEFIMFGDGPSDLSVCQEFYEKGKQTAFVYVGHIPFPDSHPFQVYRAKKGELFDQATVKFLAELSN